MDSIDDLLGNDFPSSYFTNKDKSPDKIDISTQGITHILTNYNSLFDIPIEDIKKFTNTAEKIYRESDERVMHEKIYKFLIEGIIKLEREEPPAQLVETGQFEKLYFHFHAHARTVARIIYDQTNELVWLRRAFNHGKLIIKEDSVDEKYYLSSAHEYHAYDAKAMFEQTGEYAQVWYNSLNTAISLCIEAIKDDYQRLNIYKLSRQYVSLAKCIDKIHGKSQFWQNKKANFFMRSGILCKIDGLDQLASLSYNNATILFRNSYFDTKDNYYLRMWNEAADKQFQCSKGTDKSIYDRILEYAVKPAYLISKVAKKVLPAKTFLKAAELLYFKGDENERTLQQSVDCYQKAFKKDPTLRNSGNEMRLMYQEQQLAWPWEIDWGEDDYDPKIFEELYEESFKKKP